MEKKRYALIFDGYRYLKHKTTKYKTWWRCAQHKNGCKGWIMEKDGKLFLTKKHNHHKIKNYNGNYFEEIFPVRF